jgi:hypothetical protein
MQSTVVIEDASATFRQEHAMTELLGWMIVIGLAVAIAGIFSLSSQIEKHTRQMLEIVLQSNAMIVAQLERADGALLQSPDRIVGVVLERRQAERRTAPPGMPRTERMRERRGSPDRRLDGSLQR